MKTYKQLKKDLVNEEDGLITREQDSEPEKEPAPSQEPEKKSIKSILDKPSIAPQVIKDIEKAQQRKDLEDKAIKGFALFADSLVQWSEHMYATDEVAFYKTGKRDKDITKLKIEEFVKKVLATAVYKSPSLSHLTSIQDAETWDLKVATNKLFNKIGGPIVTFALFILNDVLATLDIKKKKK